MKKIFAGLLLLFAMPIFAAPTAVSPNLKQKFQFDENGKFRLMQLSDIQDYRTLHPQVKKLIRKGIRQYRPSLIVVTGDNTHENSEHGEFEKCVNEFVKIFVSEKVPFAVTFGNHDSRKKGDNHYTRQEQYDIFRKLGGDYFVDFDIAELSGVGNGAIPLYSAKTDQPVFNIIVMDSGDYVPGTISYDACRTDQIRYYEENAGVLPCLWFQHIITPDIYGNGNFIEVRDFREAPAEKIYPVETTKDDPEGFYCKYMKKYLKKVPAGAVWNKKLKCYVVTDPKAVWVGDRYAVCDEPGVLFWYWRSKCFIKLNPKLSAEGWGEVPHSTPPWVYQDEEHTYEGRTLYQSWLKMGNLKGAYFGHDHLNYFDLTDENGIRMGGCKAAKHGVDPGFRIFDVSEDGAYTTQTVTAKDLGVK